MKDTVRISVTKREALEVYSQRYYDSKGRLKRFLPFSLFTVGLIIGLTIMYFGDDWLGVGIFGALSLPGMFLTLKAARASSLYARTELKKVRG